MKVLIISDTHGKLDNFKKVLNIEKSVDMILHLGDVCHDEEEIRELANCDVRYVRGNCDIFSYESDSLDFKIGNYNFHMEHGHFISTNLQSIAYKAEEIGADVMLFGHTHIPLLTWVGDVRIINPGSLSKPRQSDGKPTYLVMNVDNNGEIEFFPKHL